MIGITWLGLVYNGLGHNLFSIYIFSYIFSISLSIFFVCVKYRFLAIVFTCYLNYYVGQMMFIILEKQCFMRVVLGVCLTGRPMFRLDQHTINHARMLLDTQSLETYTLYETTKSYTTQMSFSLKMLCLYLLV